MTPPKKPAITDVFTPRAPRVNPAMYVERERLERSLSLAVKRNMHALLFGESGTGKSWLYKKVLDDLGISYRVANCANASRQKSLTKEIANVLVEPGTTTKIEYVETKEAGVDAVFASAKVDRAGKHQIKEKEPLLGAFEEFSRTEGRENKKILVLDNLESIFDSDALMSELADIIILLDDERYARQNVNMLIVGVPDGVIEYFAKTRNLTSVANRLHEVEKVSVLNKVQTWTLVKKGFTLLEYTHFQTHWQEIQKHVLHVTLGVPQRVHEYCEYLAHGIARHNGEFRTADLSWADKEWWKQSYRLSYVVLKRHLNSRNTSVARRNQVIYVIAASNRPSFDSSYIDAQVRNEFPGTIPKTNMGIANIMSDLSSSSSPFLKRTAGGSDYRVADPLYVICARLLLSKNPMTGRVELKVFAR